MKYALNSLVLLFLIYAVNLYAGTLEKRVIVLEQCDVYQECQEKVEAHGKLLSLPVNLRDLEPYKAIFLTFDQNTCEKSEITYPCYRTRDLDGTLGYLSIEESRHYKNLPERKFSIIALLDKKESPTFKIVLSEIRKNFPKAMDLLTDTDSDWKTGY